MFGFSGTELIVVMLVALLVINPKDLPATLRNLRDMIRKLKETASDFSSAIMEEGGLEDLKKEAQQLNKDIHHIVDLNGELQPTYSLEDLKDTLPDTHTKRQSKNTKKAKTKPIPAPSSVDK